MKEIDVGDELGPIRLTLTGDQIRTFATTAKMPGGRFTSDEEARKEGLPGQIAPGNFSLALFGRLLAETLPGTQVKRLSATFRALVRPDVEMLLHGVVTERHCRADGDLLDCDLVLESAAGDRLVIGTAEVRLPN